MLYLHLHAYENLEEIKENIKGLILQELSIDEYIGFINYKNY